MSKNKILSGIYEKLLHTYGSQSWWPAETPFEVMVGAILTQNTAWANVEKAISGLKGICELTPDGILALSDTQLAEAVRPSGYFNQKAARLKILCRFVKNYGSDVEKMKAVPVQVMRRQLLNLHGIGPETADSILLYALQRPVFVVDAYTVRLCSRLGLVDGKAKYSDVQDLFMEHLHHDTNLFNEYHALIVRHCKQKCSKRSPACNECPLESLCTFA